VAMGELECLDADLICLQEVTQPFLNLLLEQDFVREQYVVTDGRGSSIVPYGVVMLVKAEVGLQSLEFIPLPSNMGRRALAVKTVAPAAFVVTAHLESKNSPEYRAAQAAAIAAYLADEGSCAAIHVFAGDTNVMARSEENAALCSALAPLVDTYDAAGATFSSTIHPPEPPRRIDRIFVSPEHAGAVVSLELVGAAAELGLTASDHLGLVLDLEVVNGGPSRS